MLLSQAELRSALIELGEVEHAMEDVMGLLQQVEADLQQFGDVYGDPRHIEVHLRKIQVTCFSLCVLFSFINFNSVQITLHVVQVCSERPYLYLHDCQKIEMCVNGDFSDNIASMSHRQ